MNTFDLGISISTRNRWRDLEATLSAISGLSETAVCPVVVGDDGSDEPVPEGLMRRFPRAQFLTGSGRLGTSGQRNRVARALRTEFILQLDDDSYPTHGSVRDAVAFLAGRPDAAALALNISEGREAWPGIDPCSAPYRVESFLGCGVILRRSVFLDLGGYIGALGFYGEETHFSARAARAGMSIYKFPGLVIRHVKSVRARDTGRIAFMRARNRVLLVLWHYPARAIPLRLATSLPGTLALVRSRDYLSAAAGFAAGLVAGIRMHGERRSLSYGQYLTWRALPPG